MSYVRTYRPHIKRLTWHCNTLLGVIDLTFMQWWICEGFDAEGTGGTPKDAYDAWFQQFIRKNS